MSDLTLHNLSKTYPGGVRAVEGMDLHIRDGELLVLVGPSGCGKSTTLRMIAGLEMPTSGTIRIGERTVNRLPPRDRDVAMVFQNQALYPHLTVYNNMAFGLRRRRCPRDEIARRVAWVARLLGLEGLLERKPHALSGGQRQRVALGRAVVRRPKVFLLDEPLSNLDAPLRARTRVELKRLHAELRTTTIYVTHDQEEAMTLGHRIAVVRDGRLQQCGTPSEIYDAPANRFVATFLGNPAMNFLDGRLREEAGRKWFESASLRVPIEKPLLHRINGSVTTASLGVRPDTLELRAANDDETPWSIPGTVDLIEPLGGTMDVHVATADGQRLVCRMAPRAMDCGSRVSLRVDPAKVHVFPIVD